MCKAKNKARFHRSCVKYLSFSESFVCLFHEAGALTFVGQQTKSNLETRKCLSRVWHFQLAEAYCWHDDEDVEVDDIDDIDRYNGDDEVFGEIDIFN